MWKGKKTPFKKEKWYSGQFGVSNAFQENTAPKLACREQGKTKKKVCKRSKRRAKILQEKETGTSLLS